MRILRDRVIQVPIADKFTELQQSGRTPVCLFPRKRVASFAGFPANVHFVSGITVACTREQLKAGKASGLKRQVR